MSAVPRVLLALTMTSRAVLARWTADPSSLLLTVICMLQVGRVSSVTPSVVPSSTTTTLRARSALVMATPGLAGTSSASRTAGPLLCKSRNDHGIMRSLLPLLGSIDGHIPFSLSWVSSLCLCGEAHAASYMSLPHYVLKRLIHKILSSSSSTWPSINASEASVSGINGILAVKL